MTAVLHIAIGVLDCCLGILLIVSSSWAKYQRLPHEITVVLISVYPAWALYPDSEIVPSGIPSFEYHILSRD